MNFRVRTNSICGQVLPYLLAGVAGLVTPQVAWAQDASATDNASDDEAVGDIIVTARKREESSIAVPVSIVAIGQAQLEQRGIVRLDELGSLVPGLQLGEAGGGFQGGTVFLRGIGSGEANTFADLAVPFIIDGAPVGRAAVRRISEVDLAQIEVLKGPQTLFFGKSSPGGAIVMTSADPGDRLEVKAKAGYEFYAHQWNAEGVISSPLTDTLGIRVVGYWSRMTRGWLHNTLPASNPLVTQQHGPREREYGGRLTLKFDPSDSFNAKLKVNYADLKSDGSTGALQYIHCPTGSPQFGDPATCSADDGNYVRANVPASFGAIDTNFGDGTLFFHQKQLLSSLTMNYNVSDDIVLTSVSSFYHLNQRQMENFNQTLNPSFYIASYINLNFKEYNQELRLASSFDSRLNFLVGAFYQHTNLFSIISSAAFTPVRSIGNARARQDGDAISVFGQLLWKPIDTIEIAAGARYSYEKKGVDFALGAPPGVYTPVVTAVPERSFRDLSPEITLTWRPNDDLTLFGGYREGFLSGGFNAAFADLTQDRSYDQQNTKGFEGGIKARLLDRTLRVNLSLFTYQTTGLQLTLSTTLPGGIQQIRTVNAGKAITRGIEGDFVWATPLRNFTLRGGFAYLHARYKVFQTTCYRGQTIALGCNIAPNAAGVFQIQDLAGQQMVRAPDWTLNGGFDFTTPISNGLKGAISGDVAYSSSFFTHTLNMPEGKMAGYWLLSGSLSVRDADDRWEVSLIGKNLTDKRYYTRALEVPFTGTAGGSPTGLLSDYSASIARGRQIILRASVNF